MDSTTDLKVEIAKRRLRQREIALYLCMAESTVSNIINGIVERPKDRAKIIEAIEELTEIKEEYSQNNFFAKEKKKKK